MVLGRALDDMAANFGVRLVDLQQAPKQIHPIHAQCSNLSPSEAGVRQYPDECLVRGASLRQLRYLLMGQEPLLSADDAR
jgi:hypothetical protein